MTNIHLGFEIDTGQPVEIPLRHMAVTGQTQEAGKTTALEALIGRAGLRAVTFVTKRGEGAFADARRIDPYFREQADWQFVASILEASRGEKLKFERAWIIRASKGARTLGDVHRNVRAAMEKAKGLSADVYLTLDAYLEQVVPQISRTHWAPTVRLGAGVNAMDLTELTVEMQHLVIKSTLDWVLQHGEHTVVVVPEAWKFIPQGRGTPVKLAAEAYIRQGAAMRNYLWLDSQDIAGIDKIILKSVPVWILGVQREANEIKRTLDNIPAGVKRPKPNDIAHLGLGQFYACWGRHCVKTYVQPAWLSQREAIAIAKGDTGFAMTRKADYLYPPEEPEVTKEEADRLRARNAELERRVAELESSVRFPVLKDEPPPAAGPVVSLGQTFDNEALYQAIKARLAKEAPALLRVLTVKPEIEVIVERKTIEADGDTLRGRIARLIAEGFYERGQSAPGTQKELARRGNDPGPASTYKELDALAVLGFLTIEQGKDDRSRPRKEYRAVEGMKVNIVEG